MQLCISMEAGLSAHLDLGQVFCFVTGKALYSFISSAQALTSPKERDFNNLRGV